MHDAEVSAWARALAARRRVVGPIRCPECGREVVATTAGRWKKTYCSQACQLRSYRRRNPERVAAWQRAYRARKRQAAQQDQEA